MTITILDGGMGQELVARMGRATGLWAMQALIDAPQIVRDVHDAYFAAGADLATTNTYNCFSDRLIPEGLADQLEPLQRRACEMAVASRDAHGAGLVAGSLGPQGFSYQPDKCPPAAEAAEVYDQICAIQADYVDLFMAETMSSVDQARGALMGASGHGKPIWLCLSVDDTDGTKLRSGEPLGDIFPLFATYDVASVLINCSVPEAVSQAMPIMATAGLPFGAYANGFKKIAKDFNKIGATVDLLESREDLGPAAYADFAQSWADAGATLIGGCCEVGPAHITELARRLK